MPPSLGMRSTGGACMTALALMLSVVPGMADELSELRQQIKEMKAANERMEQRLVHLEEQKPRQVVVRHEVVKREIVKLANDAPSHVAAPLGVGGQVQPLRPGFIPVPGTDTAVKLGGFIKIDGVYDVHGGGIGGTSADPIEMYRTGTPGSYRNGDFQATARQSVLSFASITSTKYGDLNTFVSMDFLGGTNGNQYLTNAYSPRLKEAFVSMSTSPASTWLVGQTWSTFMDLDSYPETLDNGGPVGPVYIRQPQIRYIRNLGNGNKVFVAIESPFGDFEGNSLYPVYTNGGAPSTNILDPIPDFVAKYTKDAPWGHFAIAGLARVIEDNTGGQIVDSFKGKSSTFAYGAMTGLSLKTFGQDSINGQAVGGSGVGRYMYGEADTKFSGASLVYCPGSTTVACAIQPTTAFGTTLGYQHYWTASVRSNFVGGYAYYPNELPDNPVSSVRDIKTAFADLIWSPLPRIDIGAEFIYANVVYRRAQGVTNYPGIGNVFVGNTAAAERLLFSLKVGL